MRTDVQNTIADASAPLSPASVNRELATLRRLLGLVHEWKIIDRVPRNPLTTRRARQQICSQLLAGENYLGATSGDLRIVAVLMLELKVTKCRYNGPRRQGYIAAAIFGTSGLSSRRWAPVSQTW